MAEVAGLARERRMQELPHQLRDGRLVRIVATGAVRRREGLIVMGLLQACVLDVVAINAQCRSALGQMEVELGLARFPGLVGRVAGVASHIERGMAAAFFGDVQSLLVAIETEILAFVSRLGFQQLILVVAGMRVVTLDAIAHRRRMHRPFKSRGIFFGMATQAESLGSRSNQLDASYVFTDPNFVTAQTSRRNRRMDSLALRLILMALEALRRIDVLVERNRVLLGQCRHHLDHKKERQQLEEAGEGLTDADFPARKKTAWRRWDHCQPLHVHDPRLTPVEQLQILD